MSSRPSIQQPPTANLATLADPPIRQIDGAAMDYFLIELVATLRDSAAVATARAKKVEQQMLEAGLIPPPPPVPLSLKKESSARDSVTSLVSRTGSAAGSKSGFDDEEEPVRQRLESIGMHVGANFSERLCRDRPMFAETLDAIKFICKDIWAACWDKQVDNLRTNHRGVYVLQDNAFKPITRLSSWESRADAMKRARLYAAMPAGIIRGALSRLGFNGTVVPEITSMPQCTFQIKLPKGA
ncbi:NO signaling/Golgi transport ligand-binding domain-containing protein [Crassisporium funariophilum]|nr:NO signaling/Golgi transport ligand-binding domain-containing protein [Crassisporium funariophilum]